MADSLLSVILIAKKNKSLSFLRALKSILDQVYSPIQIVVVDINESNSMYSLGLQEDLAAFPSIEYLQLDESLSVSGIRNYTLHLAKGDYIAFLNSNDVWDSTNALLQINQLTQNPQAAASCSNGMLIDERKSCLTAYPLIGQLTFDVSKWLLDNPAKMSAQIIYKTEALKKAEGFDERFINFCDGDMLLRLSKEFMVLLLPVFLCECYITPDNEDYDWNNLKDHQRLLNKYMDRFLTDKHMTQMFYGQLIHLAKVNYLWLNLVIYIFMYFIKAPLRTFLMLLIGIGRILHYLYKWFYRELSLFKEGIRINKNIGILQKGRTCRTKPLSFVTLVEEKGKHVSFSSSFQFNEKKTLEYAFDHKLRSIVIPEYVTVIKKGMFYGCDQLISIEIPNTVLEIQAHAFHMCKNLRQVTIQEGSRLGKIGAYAFAGCSSLETISLPSGLVQLGKCAFFECSSLKKLLFTNIIRDSEKTGSIYPSAIVKFPHCIFAGCSNLMTVEFGENSMLETVENGAFLGCGRLKKIVLTGKVKSLGSYAFGYCRELETAAFPQIDALKKIGKCAFLSCEALAYFQLPNQIDRINVRTFYGCSGLKLVKIPKKVLSINHQAFAKCKSLETAIILTGDIAISPTAFDKHTKIQILENMNQDALNPNRNEKEEQVKR